MSKNYYGPQSTLIIRNLADNSSTEELRNIFKEFGDLKDVYIPLDYYTQKQRGFAYIQFEDPRDAKEARDELNGSFYLNQEMRIDIARGDRKTPLEMMRHGRDRHGRDYIRRDDDDMYEDRISRYDEKMHYYLNLSSSRISHRINRYDEDMHYQNLSIRKQERSRSRSCHRVRSRRSPSRSDVRCNRGNDENPRHHPRSPVKSNFRRVGNDRYICRNPGPNYTVVRGRRDKWNRPAYRY